VELQAGPVVTDGSAAPDLAASVRHSTRPADLGISYARTQTTIVGLSGVADTQSVTASGTVKPRQGLQLRVSPGVSRTLHGSGRTDAWRLAFEAERQLRGSVLLRVSYEANAQSGRLVTISGYAVSRHLVQVSLLAVPRIRPATAGSPDDRN
jgi:hypothetical protein